MKVHIDQLPVSTLETLRQSLTKGGPGRGAVLHRPSVRWQVVMGSFTLALGVLGITITISMAADPRMQPWGPVVSGGLSGLFLLYAAAALRDHLLRRRQGLDAFILITPTNLVRCWGAHLPLEFHRVKDATEYKTFQEYDQKQNHKGRRYRFAFGKQVVDFLVSDPRVVSEMDEVAELARTKGKGETLPDLPGTRIPDLMPTGPAAEEGFLMRTFLNPRSEFWLATGALLCLATIIAIVASRRH